VSDQWQFERDDTLRVKMLETMRKNVRAFRRKMKDTKYSLANTQEMELLNKLVN